MVLHDTEAEKSFTGPFDGRFPYNEASAFDLIREGWKISLNAAFCVLHELCRPPHHGLVDKVRVGELIAEWEKGPDHPIKAPILHAAHNLVAGCSLPWREGVALMEQVSNYEGQRAALAIAYFASVCDSPEGDAALTRIDEEIRQKWDAMGA